MKSFSSRLFFLIILLSILAGPLSAGDFEEAKVRMKERLVQIDQMKSEGKVGENSNGYLSIRTTLGPRQTSLVEGENADRRVIYQSIAQSTGQSIEEVGRQRAIRIIKLARPGVWLLKPDGEWIRKP
ncbi:YdbL family protein [Puniceicoccales bacterium CK1056]|uniref:YdbL family protein n=1 Tax=Oceanipulchritudo coccoides TaxID=2706888 RepID=A0A6B2LY88_9BACT|nr:YdbL family protein [Oceanipulchritudo coccoides]NDV61036.1 YdbL family protein [Oceanipulchritudo coccoides]